ncbi:extracellular matrix regulator RemB [Alkalicoccobacillus murimartini]|uniref:DUF370 domain-containing protein n=1 Tax=Alkalicoccobacillus murimartini TaxID=171685 RepID=A0ABT9YNS6_9BACI|nr:extracellular matrix/biofilm biosynthesis regulator RemA family protein [Alkalicoccobacillus murimartini]MDQ0209145.1 hypothetical protein [Alkalicoccobacillus murimartini]
MFIHLGGDVMIRAIEIIAILQYEKNDIAEETEAFLAKANDSITITPDLVKSVIITDQVIYYSPVSSVTLNRRVLTGTGIKEDIE